MKTTLTAMAALMIAVSPLAAETAAPTFVAEQNNSEVLGSDFVGTQVVSKDKQPLGKVANLVFDQSGRIELAVIGIGGFLGIGEKEVAVPFETLASSELNNKHVFIVDLSKDQLKAAPAFKTLNDKARHELLESWRSKAQSTWSDLKTKAGKAYEEAKEKTSHAYDEAKEKASKAYTDAKEDVKEAKDKVEQKAGQATDAAKDAAQDAKDKVEQKAQ